MRRLLVLTMFAAVVGCCNVDIATSPPVMGGDVVAHAVSYNYGWNLFGCIPVVCGNDDLDAWCPFAFFRDEVSGERVQARLARCAEALDCELTDVTCFNDRDIFFDFYYAPLPWIIQFREANCSATFVKKGGAR